MKQNKSRFTKYTIKDEHGNDVEVIRNLLLTDVTLNWVFVTTPDDEGKFRADAVISDPEDIRLIQEYLNVVIEKSKNDLWGGTIPAKAFYPVRAPLADSEIEKDGKLVIKLKASPKNRPLLYIRESSEHEPREVIGRNTEIEEVAVSELREFHSGMVADIIINASGYAPKVKGHASGVTFWLNSLCKTGEGIRFAPAFNEEDEYMSAFTVGGVTTKGLFTPPKSDTVAPVKTVENPQIQNATKATKAPIKLGDLLEVENPKTQKAATHGSNPLADLESLIKNSTPEVEETASTSSATLSLNDLLKL